MRAGPPRISRRSRLLELDEHAAADPGWTKSDGGRDTRSPFATRQLMLGLLCAYPRHLPDSQDAWSTFLISVGAGSLFLGTPAWHRTQFRDRRILQFHESEHPQRSGLRLHGPDHRFRHRDWARELFLPPAQEVVVAAPRYGAGHGPRDECAARGIFGRRARV